MKNLKTYENFKRIIGGSKLALAGAGFGATLLMTGCSGCSVEKEPTAVVSEIPSTETPSEVTSEVPSVVYDNSEEPVVEATVEMPELPILDENGNPYVAPTLTADDIYAAIDNLEKYNLSDYERDRVIMTILYFNGAKLSDTDFDVIRNDYLGNIGEATFSEPINEFRKDFVNRENSIALSDLLVDKKEKEIADEIELYYNSDSFNDDDWRQFFVDYTNEIASTKEGTSLGIAIDYIYDCYDVDFVCDIESFGGTFEMEDIIGEFNSSNRDRFNRQDYPEYDDERSYVSSHKG